jgi:hypothetical protein
MSPDEGNGVSHGMELKHEAMMKAQVHLVVAEVEHPQVGQLLHAALRRQEGVAGSNVAGFFGIKSAVNNPGWAQRGQQRATCWESAGQKCLLTSFSMAL